MALRAPLRVQDIDLTDLELFVQGHAHDAWRLLRAEAPVHWNSGTALFPGFWSVTTYADVVTVSRDTTTYGVVNLLPVDMLNEHKGTRQPGSSRLCGGGKVRDVLPGAESLPQLSTVVGGGEAMTLRAEVLRDGTIRREEALGVPW
jgi:hypothetical protein